MADPCVVCLRDTSNKAKPGIFPCLGCKQMFCTQHVAFHRQELANELDLVIGERNELQETFDHHPDLPNTSFQVNTIDEWVKKTIEQVHQVADNARQHLFCLAQEQRKNIENQFTELSKQLNDIRENENFYEQNIANMRDRCNRLKAATNQVNIGIHMTDVAFVLNGCITFRQEQTTIDFLSYVETLLKCETPYKQIKLPHDGSLYAGNGTVLVSNGADYTIVNVEDNSMKSLSFRSSKWKVSCWSPYHGAYLCMSDHAPKTINFISISGIYHEREIPFVSEGNILHIACFSQQLLLVCKDQRNCSVIEEWRFINAKPNEKVPPPPELMSRWRSPLSCLTNESIEKIAFNDKHIVLAIKHNNNKSIKPRIEFRTRGMLVLTYFVLNDCTDSSLLILLSMKDGWIFGQKHKERGPWQYTLIDTNLYAHEQKLLTAQDIENIAVVNYPLGKQSLVICRKKNDFHMFDGNNQGFVLDFYGMRQ